MKRHKYGAKATERDGIKFSSTKEANRYTDLKYMEKARVIKDLELQPRYNVVVNGHKICYYLADFRYFDIEKDIQVVEDVKAMPKTAKGQKAFKGTGAWRMYRLKKKLVEALHQIEITEV